MYLISSISVLLHSAVVLCVFAPESRNNSDNGLGKVIFVNVLFRHGARTPLEFYPNDPYKHAFPEGKGELTNVGKNQTYKLGKWLRKRYKDLLPVEYNQKYIYVEALDNDRLLMSAESCMAGMFPPKGDQVWNREINWQPIPIHISRILSKKSCPAYVEERERVLRSKTLRKLFKKYQYPKIINIINKNTGLDIDKYDYHKLHHVYDTLLIESENKLKLPTWTQEIFPQPMETAAVFGYAIPTWTTKLARLLSGPTIKEMIDNIMYKLEENTQRVMVVKVDHDSTVAHFLSTLNVWDKKFPPYAACVMLELRRNSNGGHYVMLFYRYSPLEKPRLLTIPGCDKACPLHKFIAITRPVVPRNRRKECEDVDYD